MHQCANILKNKIKYKHFLFAGGTRPNNIPLDDVYYVVPGPEDQVEGEDPEPKVYVSTTQGLKKVVERRHSQNSDRSNNSGKGKKKSRESNSNPTSKLQESNSNLTSKSQESNSNARSNAHEIKDPLNAHTTKKFQTSRKLSKESGTSGTISNLSEPISNMSDNIQTGSNLSEPGRNLESSLSSSSDVSLPPGLSSGQSTEPSPTSSSSTSPNR